MLWQLVGFLGAIGIVALLAYWIVVKRRPKVMPKVESIKGWDQTVRLPPRNDAEREFLARMHRDTPTDASGSAAHD